MRPLVLAAAWIAYAICAGTSAGQEAAPPRFRSGIEIVRITALVTERGGPVTGLTSQDFVVSDNGVAQRVAVEPLDDVPIDLILALDVSSSIAADAPTLLKAAKTALAELAPEDRIAVVRFTNRIDVVTPPTHDHVGLAGRLANDSRAGAYTSLVDATFAALTLADPAGPPTLLLVLTDGLDTASWLEPHTVLAAAERSSVTVYPIRPDRGHTFPMASWLVRLATATGGELWSVDSADDVGSALGRAIKQFRRRYEIRYTPSNGHIAGWHRVDVRLKNRDGVRVRARPGYFR